MINQAEAWLHSILGAILLYIILSFTFDVGAEVIHIDIDELKVVEYLEGC